MKVYMNTVNDFGYSYIDWEYAKRKLDEPELSFDDVLKESIDKLKDEDEVEKKISRRYRRMTREEAIKMLKYNSNVIHQTINGETDHKEVEALGMAIKALEQEPILDKMRDEVINRYPKNYAGEPELGGSACEFSLNQILQIIDKYKAEMGEKNDNRRSN